MLFLVMTMSAIMFGRNAQGLVHAIDLQEFAHVGVSIQEVPAKEWLAQVVMRTRRYTTTFPHFISIQPNCCYCFGEWKQIKRWSARSIVTCAHRVIMFLLLCCLHNSAQHNAASLFTSILFCMSYALHVSFPQSTCSGHGECVTMAERAYFSTVDGGVPLDITYGKDPSYAPTWDAHKWVSDRYRDVVVNDDWCVRGCVSWWYFMNLLSLIPVKRY